MELSKDWLQTCQCNETLLFMIKNVKHSLIIFFCEYIIFLGGKQNKFIKANEAITISVKHLEDTVDKLSKLIITTFSVKLFWLNENILNFFIRKLTFLIISNIDSCKLSFHLLHLVFKETLIVHKTKECPLHSSIVFHLLIVLLNFLCEILFNLTR